MEICEKSKCTGCFACVNACPWGCVSMQEDAYGEMHPVIDELNCRHCEKCKRVCPNNADVAFAHPKKCYASWIRDSAKRSICASGGVATILSEYVIRKGGVVYGTAYDDFFTPRVVSAECITDIEKFKGSKYVQSIVGEKTFCLIEKTLREGILVLFIGTPCQVAGLKCYLQKDYENLITADLICHGVCPTSYFKKEIAYIMKKRHLSDLSDIRFRGNDGKNYCLSLWKSNSKGNSLNSSTINYNSHINLKLNTSSSVSNMDDEIIKLIEKDIAKYKEFFNTNNITNRYDLIKNMQIGNEFDWSSIEEILSMSKIYLAEIIRCYVEVCIDEIIDSNQIYIVNDYIKNIICYYSTELTNKERDIIHNKVVNLFLNIRDICIDNENMKNIMGYLLLILIENKLYFIKNLNNFIGLEKEIIITIAEVVKFAIISSEEKSRKYHNDFKQTKLFADNPIFNEKVTNSIGDILK